MQYSDKRKSFQDQCGLVTFQESVDFTGYEIHASWSHQLQSLNGDQTESELQGVNSTET